LVLGIWQISPMEPPNFIVEPPSLIYFSNTTGTLINCQGQGNPQPNITWLLYNDRIVTDIPRLRYVYFILYNIIRYIKNKKILNVRFGLNFSCFFFVTVLALLQFNTIFSRFLVSMIYFVQLGKCSNILVTRRYSYAK